AVVGEVRLDVDFEPGQPERSFRGMGGATELDLARYLPFPRFRPGARRAALREMLERGEVVEVELEGAPGRWLVLAGDLPALTRAERAPVASDGTTLLSPFDSLMCHRDRVARLFGFEYRIEVYTPGPKRVHGYYTLPILHHGHLIGRVDSKAHRADRKLEVRHVHFEPWFAAAGAPPRGRNRLDQDEAIAGVAKALTSLGVFVGA